MNYYQKALQLHEKHRGKLETASKVKIETKEDLSVAYSPGVAEPCREIAADVEAMYKYTNKGNLVAVVTDGSAVLGLGDIGAGAGMPVMEGKAILFKEFAGVDAFPILISSKDSDEIVETVKRIAVGFGGINLEDISAPRCFEIERRLKEELEIPVFHDDQHGTAAVVLAGLINALKLTGRKMESSKILVNGAGAAGVAIVKLLVAYGVSKDNIWLCDSKGVIYKGREDLNDVKEDMAEVTNVACLVGVEDPACRVGGLEAAVEGIDVFLGVSKGGLLTPEMVKRMAKDPIIFAMANPDPEILPDVAAKAGAAIVATGRSDFPNQINNVLCFPGLFRGVLDARMRDIDEKVMIAAAEAIARYVDEPRVDAIIPSPLDKNVAKAVAEAVKKCKT